MGIEEDSGFWLDEESSARVDVPSRPKRAIPELEHLRSTIGGKSNPEYMRAYQRFYLYSLSPLAAEQLLEAQGGGCAICGIPITLNAAEDDLPLAQVDHDHSCCPVGVRGSKKLPTCGGCTRGLLCASCNHLIGLASDSPLILARAISYLTEE